mgnify:CR=1 FL=1
MDARSRTGGLRLSQKFCAQVRLSEGDRPALPVSYPTVRLRLDKLIQKIELADQQEEEPFTAFIKGLAVDSRIDVETAKQIIDKYEKERKHI